MAVKLILDTVDGAEADVSGGALRAVRGAMVTNIDTSSPADVLLRLINDTPGMPAKGSSLSARFFNFQYSRVVVRAIRGRIAILRLIYEDKTAKIVSGSPMETFSAEDVTTLSTGTTQLLPVDLTQLRVVFGTSETETDLAAGETATVSYPVPMRSLVLSGLFSIRPNITLQQAVRKVNDGVWMGLPKGYWLFSGVSVRWSSLTEAFAVTCTATTKGEEDWSSYSAVRGPDGKFIRVPDAATTALRAQDYAFGVRHRAYGLLKVGLFRTANFSSLFGIG